MPNDFTDLDEAIMAAPAKSDSPQVIITSNPNLSETYSTFTGTIPSCVL